MVGRFVICIGMSMLRCPLQEFRWSAQGILTECSREANLFDARHPCSCDHDRRAGPWLKIGDPMQDGGLNREVNASIGTHILIGLGALSGTTLVHALLFTYFMGTGRWIEETSSAYHLPETYFKANQK